MKRIFGMMGLVGMMTSCGHVYLREETYDAARRGRIREVEIQPKLEPQGGDSGFSASAMVYFAGSAKTHGPFKWKILARGQNEDLLGLKVHGVRVETKQSGRKESFPKSWLGHEVAFKPVRGKAGQYLAVFEMPGTLEVLNEKDGGLQVWVDATVRDKRGKERRELKFELQPVSRKDVDFIFIPGEVAKSFGNSEAYAEDE